MDTYNGNKALTLKQKYNLNTCRGTSAFKEQRLLHATVITCISSLTLYNSTFLLTEWIYEFRTIV
jgi:hypothetical protein